MTDDTTDAYGLTLPENDCPVCSYKMECATSVHGNHRPSPGDVTVCINCGVILQFTDQMGLKLCDPAIEDEMRTRIPTLGIAQDLIRKLNTTSQSKTPPRA